MAFNANNGNGFGNGTLTQTLIPTLFAQGLKALRSNLVMPRMVMNNFGTEARRKGETILIPMPSNMTTQDVAPGAYAPDPQAIAPADAAIPLTNWKEAAFTLTEADVGNIIEGVAPMQLSAAMQALAFQVNASIFGLYTSVPNVVSDTLSSGTVVTPFSQYAAVATQAGAILTQAYAPLNDRKIVLSPGAYGSALVLPQFAYALYAGDKDAIDQGIITKKFGFDWAQDQQVPYVTPGTVAVATLGAAIAVQSNGTIAAGGGTAGAVPGQPISITVATGTGGSLNLKAGDVLIIQNGSTTMPTVFTPGVLTATVVAPVSAGASASTTVSVIPGAALAMAGASTGWNVIVAPAHTVNLAFHREAFAFASRPLEMDRMGIQDPDLVHQVSDPVSGISLRLILRPEFHRTRAAFDILWGVAPVRPELAVRIMGGVNG